MSNVAPGAYLFGKPRWVQQMLSKGSNHGIDAAIAADIKPVPPKFQPHPERLHARHQAFGRQTMNYRAKVQDIAKQRFMGDNVPVDVQREILLTNPRDPWIHGHIHHKSIPHPTHGVDPLEKPEIYDVGVQLEPKGYVRRPPV